MDVGTWIALGALAIAAGSLLVTVLGNRNNVQRAELRQRDEARKELLLQRRRIALIRDLESLRENARPSGDPKLANVERGLRNWVSQVEVLLDANPEFAAAFPPFTLCAKPFDTLDVITIAYDERRQILEVMMGIRNGPLYRDLV